MPQVAVRNVGTIAIPVQHTQVRSLIAAAERAPFGRGPDTVLDTAVRDCWQISSRQVDVGGCGWPDTLNKIMRRVAEGIGCQAERLHVQLHKLLV